MSESNEKLNKIYKELLPMKQHGHQTISPLTSRTAIMMQRILVIYAFKKFLGLKLKSHEANVLQHYSSVSLALITFLEYCGCPGHKGGLLPIEIKLEMFIVHGEVWLCRFGQRQKLSEDYKRLKSFVNPLYSLWLRIRIFLLRRSLAEGKSNFGFIISQDSHHYDLLDMLATFAGLKLNQMQQEGVVAILALKIHIKSVIMLAKYAPVQQDNAYEAAFCYARDNLESNFSKLNK